jgi:hypothetical protein
LRPALGRDQYCRSGEGPYPLIFWRLVAFRLAVIENGRSSGAVNELETGWLASLDGDELASDLTVQRRVEESNSLPLKAAPAFETG